VLAEATEEAGERPVDAELLAVLTEALAAGFDKGRYGAAPVLQMLKNVRFGPCSSSTGSHPAPS
jgi:hypothetical protein